MSERRTKKRGRAGKAYLNETFLHSSSARPLRILSEYLEPKKRFDESRIDDTIVFMGSARLRSREDAMAAVRAAEAGGGDIDVARRHLAMSRYYEDARELAHRFTVWSKALADEERRFVVCTGGGPGVMEAANRGASEAKGLNVGLTISIPIEEFDNPYVTRDLSFRFPLLLHAQVLVRLSCEGAGRVPGRIRHARRAVRDPHAASRPRKMSKNLVIVLFGTQYWEEVVNFDALVRHGTIDRKDLDLFHRTDSVDEAFQIITTHLEEHAMAERGAFL